MNRKQNEVGQRPTGYNHTTRLRAADHCPLPANSASEGDQAGARFFSVALWSTKCLRRGYVSSVAVRAWSLSGFCAPCFVLDGVSGQFCNNAHGFHVTLCPSPVRGFWRNGCTCTPRTPPPHPVSQCHVHPARRERLAADHRARASARHLTPTSIVDEATTQRNAIMRKPREDN